MKKIMILLVMALSMIGLMMTVAAFDITAPENKTYETGNITFSVSHAEVLDSITYKIDGGEVLAACGNCSGYDADLILAEGQHTIEAFGVLGNESFNETVGFTIEFPEEEPTDILDFAVELISPVNEVYDETTVQLRIEGNTTVDSISFAIDNETEILACENCSEYEVDLVFEEGEHEVTVYARIGDVERTTSVEFEIILPEEEPEIGLDFTFEVEAPEAKEYEPGEIYIKVESNETLDKITVSFAGYEGSCENCSVFEDKMNLTQGNYTLRAKGELGNELKETVVIFKVAAETDDDDDNDDETDDDDDEAGEGPRFTTGFEKLPKMFEAGEITDAELADILSQYQLNPGIINRLIKTGMLGNESLEAILDHQEFRPSGIWKKLLAFIGYKGNTYAAEIAEVYESKLPEKIQQKMVVRNDIPKGQAKKIQARLQEHVENLVRAQDRNVDANPNAGYDSNNAKKTMNIGKQVPPGQAKKQGNTESDDAEEAEVSSSGKGNSGKIPPGQAKKALDSGNGNSNAKGNNGNGKNK
ncbi:MAG: hypothetical protein KKF44_01310 [Nanoarchaeota archaeon]|nr:hypothetical protein [Nanoarchaeota archaeon]